MHTCRRCQESLTRYWSAHIHVRCSQPRCHANLQRPANIYLSSERWSVVARFFTLNTRRKGFSFHPLTTFPRLTSAEIFETACDCFTRLLSNAVTFAGHFRGDRTEMKTGLTTLLLASPVLILMMLNDAKGKMCVHIDFLYVSICYFFYTCIYVFFYVFSIHFPIRFFNMFLSIWKQALKQQYLTFL